MDDRDDRDVAESSRLFALVKEAVDRLGEEFENIQVFANRNEGETTRSITLGAGNIFAREGHIQSWIERGGLSFREDDE